MKWSVKQRMGRLGAWLYKTGWQQSTSRHLGFAQHLLLGIFYYYRKGFQEGTRYKKIAIVNQLKRERR